MKHSTPTSVERAVTCDPANAPEQLSPTNRPDPANWGKLEVEALGVAYGRAVALSDVSMAIPTQEITAIIGPSGCGKSTFLGALNRMVELTPRARVTGRVLLDGEDIYGPTVNVTHLRRRVGMIFQKPTPFPLSIRRNITLALAEQGVKGKAAQAEVVEQALTDVGLWEEVRDRLDQSALALSGGQQQRLCIARALALRPEVLLLDEPCSALDPIASETIEGLILRLREHFTIVIVTHNLAQARRVADSVALFWQQEGTGRLVEHGACEQFFEAPRQELTASYVFGRRG